jgi:hypothetical protein
VICRKKIFSKAPGKNLSGETKNLIIKKKDKDVPIRKIDLSHQPKFRQINLEKFEDSYSLYN